MSQFFFQNCPGNLQTEIQIFTLAAYVTLLRLDQARNICCTNRGARKQTGESLKPVLAKFSTMS